MRFARTIAVAGFTACVIAGNVHAASWPGRKQAEPSEGQKARLAQYDHLIEYFTSLRYGPTGAQISGAYIRSLVLAESSARKTARSHKGARGLTQIMPATGRAAVRQIVASGKTYRYVDRRTLEQFHPDSLYHPAVSILIACHLSAQYLKNYGGRTDLVASAWNAGEEAVEDYGFRPPPFHETITFLGRIRGYLTWFQNGTEPDWTVRTARSGRKSAGGRAFTTPGWDTDWNDPDWSADWSADSWEISTEAAAFLLDDDADAKQPTAPAPR